MKIFILTINLLFYFNLSGQSIKISEMMTQLEVNNDDFDTWILKKGYKLTSDENSKDENCQYFYAYTQKTILTNEIAFYKCIYDGYKPNIAFRTQSEENYLSFKTELKTLGFIFTETVTRDQGKLIFYTLHNNGKEYELSLATTTYNDYNLYEVALTIK
jgi:hypothetical protein